MFSPTRTRTLARAAITLACSLTASSSSAQTITLESGTMGATGQFGGVSVTLAQFVGWRFQIDAPLIVDRIGGHFAGDNEPGGVFAAMVALPAIDAFPAGAPFTTEEVLATTIFEAPFPSEEIRVPFSAALAPGSYALVFGSNLFGATGEAAIVNSQDQDDIPPTNISSFIFWGITGPGDPPIWRTNLASHMRIVIEGRAPAAGDFDEDGDVDGDDLARWTTSFGQTTATHTRGDADADQDVDGADFLIWQQELADDSPIAVSVSVPEPTTATLLLTTVAALATRWVARPTVRRRAW
jgi:hypothetical protein